MVYILSACQKEPLTGSLSFSAAYASGVCMYSGPSTVIIDLGDVSVEIPVREINTGVISTESVELPFGSYRLHDIKVVDGSGNITSYFEKDFHGSGWVVTPILDNWYVDIDGDTTIRGQLFCDAFWNKTGR